MELWKTIKDKGILRSWQFWLPAVVLVMFALPAWTEGRIPMIGTGITMGLSALYFGSRVLTHVRTHELDSIEENKRSNALILAAGLVIALAVHGGLTAV